MILRLEAELRGLAPGPHELSVFLVHPVGGRRVRQVGDPGEYLVSCGVGELAPADRLVQGGAQPGHALVQESLVDLDRDDAAATAAD